MALALVVAGTLAPLLVLILADLESAGGLFVAVACTAGVIGVAALLYGLWLVARSGGIWSGWTGGRSWRASRSTESITARSRALLWLAVGVYLVVWQVGLFGVGFLLFFSDTR